jgi:hypothetical protein
VVEGKAVANRWKSHGIVSFIYYGDDDKPRKIINLRGMLDNLTTPDKLSVLLEWVQFFRDHGANVGSPSGMAYSLWRATLESPVIESRNLNQESLSIGGRQDYQYIGSFPNVALWDITAAYSSTLGNVLLPRRWRHYEGPGWDETAPIGVARAFVKIPRMTWGPLPIPVTLDRVRLMVTGAPMPNTKFPIQQTVFGVWSNDELRQAIEVGCDVEIVESWVGRAAKPVFAAWWQVVQEGRDALSADANKLLKWAANSLWGRFAAKGTGSVIWYDGNRKHQERSNRRLNPQSLSLAALVSGTVRTRLYSEALMPWDFAVIACHTDGVWLPAGFKLSPNGGAPGHWRKKQETESLFLLGPQSYRYLQDGDWRYVLAGIPPKAQERVFLKLAGKLADGTL